MVHCHLPPFSNQESLPNKSTFITASSIACRPKLSCTNISVKSHTRSQHGHHQTQLNRNKQKCWAAAKKRLNCHGMAATTVSPPEYFRLSGPKATAESSCAALLYRPTTAVTGFYFYFFSFSMLIALSLFKCCLNIFRFCIVSIYFTFFFSCRERRGNKTRTYDVHAYLLLFLCFFRNEAC